MFFYQPIVLKNGQKCILRNAEASDAVRHHDYFVQTHKRTSFLPIRMNVPWISFLLNGN